MLIVPHALWTYGSLVAMLGAMSLWMASPVHAQSINASNDVSVACSDNAIANSPWGMVYCTDEDRAVANVAAAFASDRETNERPVPLAPLDCSYTGRPFFFNASTPLTVTCTGGRGNEVSSGLTADTFINEAGVTGSSASNANNFVFNINDFEDSPANSSGHVINMDLASGTHVTVGLVTVNLQNTSGTREILATASNAAGLNVNARAGIVINNGTTITHQRSGQSYNGQFRGIVAIARNDGTTKTVTITNSGNIGNNCSRSGTNCGLGHFGIEIAPSTNNNTASDVTVTNTGWIRLGGNNDDGDASAGIFVQQAGGAVTISNNADIRIGNTGNRFGRAIATAGAGEGMTVNFQGGNVEAYYVVDVTRGEADDDITINVSGGRVSGAVHLQGGDDTLNVMSGGVMQFLNNASAGSEFREGDDSVTVNSGGAVWLGEATGGSDLVDLNGLDTFTIKGGATLRMFMDSTFTSSASTSFIFGTFGGGDLKFDGSGLITLELVLPSGYTLANRAAFDLIDVEESNNTLDFENGADVDNIRVRLIASNGNTLGGYYGIVTEGSGEKLRVAWQTVTASTMNCSFASATVTCTGGNTGDDEFRVGMHLRRIFADVTQLASYTGDLTVTLNNLSGNIGSGTPTDHAVNFDGTASGSFVSGKLTVNMQTNSSTKRAIESPVANRAGLRVWGSGEVVVNNAAEIRHKRTGNDYDSAFRGILARAGGTSALTVSNSGNIGVSCTSDCGVAHRGLELLASGNSDSGSTVTVTNSGNITFGPGDSGSNAGSSGIFVTRAGGTVTITNTGNINVANAAGTADSNRGKAISLQSNSVVNFNGGTVDAHYFLYAERSADYTLNATINGGTVRGALRWHGGNAVVTVNNGGVLDFRGTSEFAGGDNSLTVNSGGTVYLGHASTEGTDEVNLNGLDTFTVKAGTTLRLFMRSDFGASTHTELTFGSGDFVFDGSGTYTIEIVLPSGYTLADRNAFDLINVDGNNNTLDFINGADVNNVNVILRQGGNALSGYIVTPTDSGTDGEILRVQWLTVTPSTLACSGTPPTISCSGGTASDDEITKGITLRRIFADVSALGTSYTGNLVINLDNLVADLNTANDTTTHAIFMNAGETGSRVSGNLTVNVQTNSAIKRSLFVSAANTSGMYLLSQAGLTINNASNIVHSQRNNAYNDQFRGIIALANGTGNATITNTGNIGNSCTDDCGAGHWGMEIVLPNASDAGNITVTNRGNITIGGDSGTGAGSGGIYVAQSGGSATIDNYGNISVGDTSDNDGSAIVTGGSDDGVTVNFRGGTVTATYALRATRDADYDVAMNVNGGTVTGRFRSYGGDDTVTVNNGGTYIMSNGTSDFGDGSSDDIIVNSGGSLRLGDASNGSDGVDINGVETFTVKSGATLRIFMDSTFSDSAANKFTFDSGDFVFDGSGTVTLEIVLPSGYTLATRDAFDLIDVDGSNNTLDFSGGFSVSDFNVRLIRGGVNLGSYLATVSEVSGEKLQVQWRLLTANSLTCSPSNSNSTISCSSGSAAELANGLTAAEIFSFAGSDVTRIAGAGVINLNNFGVDVNTDAASNTHGIEIDGTAGNPDLIGGNITVNHQTNSVTKRSVFVRGANQAALFVKGAASVTVTNAANLVFAQSGNVYNSLIGITAQSAGTGNVSVTNNSGARIGFASDCSSNCGSAHRGIAVIHDGSGTVSVSNAGTIRVLGSGSGDAGILVAAGTETGAVTITNTGTINTSSGDAISLSGGASNDTATINLSGTVTAGDELVSSTFAGAVTTNITGGTVTGTVTLGGGNDRVNVSGGTLTGTLSLGGGNDSVTVSGGTLSGTLDLGGGNDSVTVSGGRLAATFNLGGGNDGVTVNSGGNLVINNGASNFGAGTDSVTVNSGGNLTMGDATNGSDGVSIAGVENFTLEGGSTLNLFVNNNFSTISMSGATLAVRGEGNAPTIVINLPSGYDLSAGGDLNLFTASSLSIGVTASSGDDAPTLAGLAARVRFVQAGTLLKARDVAFSVSGTNILKAQWAAIQRVDFSDLAIAAGANQRQLGIARVLQTASLRDGSGEVFDHLYNVLEEVGNDRHQNLGEALDRVSAPIYGTMVQANWFADQQLAEQVLNQSCAQSNYLGKKRYSTYSALRRQGQIVCGRTAIWGSLLRKTDKEGTVGFNEDSPINFAAFWDLSLTNQIHMSFGGSYSLLAHENNRGGESDGHRVSFAASGHFAPSGLLQTDGFRAGGAITLGVTAHDMERATFNTAVVESEPVFVNYGVHAKVAYRAYVDADVYMEPSAGISATQIFMQDVEENNLSTVSGVSPFNLNVNDEHFNFTSLRTALLFGGDYLYPGDVTFQPLFKIGMTYVLSGFDEIDITSQLAADRMGNSFTYTGVMDDIYVDFAAGVQLFADEQFFGSLDYDGMVGINGDVGRHSATFKLSF